MKWFKHIHYWRMTRTIVGPFACSSRGVEGNRLYNCRCGEERWGRDWQRHGDAATVSVPPPKPPKNGPSISPGR